MCGETQSQAAVHGTAQGLSPRVRGNHFYRLRHGPPSGSIPRVCGGTRAFCRMKSKSTGLSPRVRGNLRRIPRNAGADRSIPACAGETERRLEFGRAPSGLSPRVRGNQALGVGRNGLERSIPACAGEPKQTLLRVKRFRVYPRVCGGTCTDVYPDGGDGIDRQVCRWLHRVCCAVCLGADIWTYRRKI